MPISVASRDNSVRIPRAFAAALTAVVRVTLAGEDRRPGEVAIVLTRDAELRELNRRWRRIDRATDVLSFPYSDERGRIDGDLVISLDRLAAQAKRYRVSTGKELLRLVVHGTLHLCGHDHHKAGERTRMRSRERAAMRASAGRVAALDRVLG
jgi:probable rRNA maturation factor